MKIIIPARLGSKGLPFKNRKLFSYTADSIPESFQVWVTTDDPEIKAMAIDRKFGVIDRPEELATDTASIRDVMYHAISSINIWPDDIVIMLYLTYPERTWQDIDAALEFFLNYYQLGISESLLCKKEVKTHPFLSMTEHGVDGIFGKQIVDHDLYRRQDYPKCFEISHYISIFKANSIYKLNRNLYCDTTVFYPISDVIDVDTQKEFDLIHG